MTIATQQAAILAATDTTDADNIHWGVIRATNADGPLFTDCEPGARREALRAWAERKEAEYHAHCPFTLELFLDGCGSTAYLWGHFTTVERAHLAARDAMKPLAASQKPYGKRCIAYRITDVTTGETVDPLAVEKAA